MKMEVFEALTAANIPAEKARAVADSLDVAIDRRYSLHSQQLATRADLAELKNEIIMKMAEMQRWMITAMIAAIGVIAAIVKMLA